MKIWLLISVLASLGLPALAQKNYDVSLIPKTLLARAGAVIRNDETTIEVKGLDEVYYRKKHAITILNESALDEASLVIGYDKTTSIRSVSGRIFDESGNPIFKISEKNMQDRSAVSDVSLFDDDRVKFFSPAKLSYPFTIEYEYEIRTRQSLFFPSWIPMRTTGVAVESSVLNFVCPESFILRFKELNFKGKADESLSEGIKTYRWQLNNVNAIRDEPFSPHYEDYLPTVKLAPEKFAYKNLKGSFSNWEEFGRWMSDNLLKGRDELSEPTKAHILGLVKNISDPKEKAKKIYSYMQSKTRYISVQIGIGGYQPYPALDVDRLGYGDCKGLVNYMQALLKVAGIESYYTIVQSGSFKKDIMPDFTSLQGDHIILCLPFKNDTTWLECTSKDAPFGFLGDFTDDRYVIACTPQGGKVMRTPRLSATDNKQIRTANFKIADNGSLSGKMTTLFSGAQYDNHHTLLNEAYTEQKKKLPKLYTLPNLEIEFLEFTQHKDASPETREIITLNSSNYCNINEGRLSIKMNGLNQMRPLKEIRNRVNPVKVPRGFYDEDTITYLLPEGYKIGLPPKSTIIENAFGKYSANVTINGKTITYKRTMLLNEGYYTAEQYDSLVTFFQEISDADNLIAILNKI
ncbi:DUF3857 and transglutaminase domain-containing protein [Paradesertivirga mongoliensis]|uniref:DUF3857 and transglutaminase domain-containing protein n=1 Tax=Paradesertivirga mongoliensis TaxID=2100740 RepID=A0ABW4ZMV7_9SPHI|nr:DUF3857 and transglutaminase domain-containing protein [Pedobacter mongoliensis]